MIREHGGNAITGFRHISPGFRIVDGDFGIVGAVRIRLNNPIDAYPAGYGGMAAPCESSTWFAVYDMVDRFVRDIGVFGLLRRLAVELPFPGEPFGIAMVFAE